MSVPERIRRLVKDRAGFRCEYCRMRERWEPFHPYHIEHVVAKQHRGGDAPENLALACNHCNLLKGPNLTSLDPDGDVLVPLFHPRQMRWEDHFTMRQGLISGLTATGRTTVFLLEMNDDHQVSLRSLNLWDW